MKKIPILICCWLALVWLLGLASAHAADGSPVWTNIFNGTGNGDDGATAMALDTNGNVYVTGYSAGSGSGQDFATIKYSPAGTALWTKRFNGPGNSSDYPNALAVDGSGNVYVTGKTYDGSGGGFNYATIKYSTTGTLGWANFYSSPGDSQDQATAIAVDSSGNVFVSGLSGYTGSSGCDFATIKYSAAGAALWTNRFHVANSTLEPVSLALDASGNVYVSGSAVHGDLSGGFDYATLKYSSAGVALWTNIYNAGGYPNNRHGKILAVDGVGNVYVTGATTGSAPGDATVQDYATLKYSTDGVPLWTNRFNGPGNDGDWFPVIAVDAGGSANITGYSRGIDSFYDYATIRYSPAGTALWTNRFNGAANNFDGGDAIAVDDSGNVYVTGSSTSSGGYFDNVTIKYSPAGAALWTNLFPTLSYDYITDPPVMAADQKGNVYVSGTVYDHNGVANFFTIKYSGPPPPLLFVTTNGGFGVTNRQFVLTLTGPAGSNAVISASTNLQSWVPLVTNQLSGGTLQFTDTLATNYLQRFYRAILK